MSVLRRPHRSGVLRRRALLMLVAAASVLAVSLLGALHLRANAQGGSTTALRVALLETEMLELNRAVDGALLSPSFDLPGDAGARGVLDVRHAFDDAGAGAAAERDGADRGELQPAVDRCIATTDVWLGYLAAG